MMVGNRIPLLHQFVHVPSESFQITGEIDHRLGCLIVTLRHGLCAFVANSLDFPRGLRWRGDPELPRRQCVCSFVSSAELFHKISSGVTLPQALRLMPAFEGFGVGFLEAVQVGPSSVQIGITDGVDIDLGGEERREVKLRLALPDQFRDQGGAASGETGFRNLEGLVEKVAVHCANPIAKKIDLLMTLGRNEIPATDPECGILGVI